MYYSRRARSKFSYSAQLCRQCLHNSESVPVSSAPALTALRRLKPSSREANRLAKLSLQFLFLIVHC